MRISLSPSDPMHPKSPPYVERITKPGPINLEHALEAVAQALIEFGFPEQDVRTAIKP